MVRQLAYSTELLVCINEDYKQYKQKRRRSNSLNSTLLSQALSILLCSLYSLCFSLVLQYIVSLSAPLFIIKTLSFSQIWQPPYSMVRQPTMPNLAAMFDSIHAWRGCHHHHLVSTLNKMVYIKPNILELKKNNKKNLKCIQKVKNRPKTMKMVSYANISICQYSFILICTLSQNCRSVYSI